MNRRKSDTRSSAHTIIALIMAAAIAAGGGVMHAIYKNKQVTVLREIDASERRIGEYQLDIQTFRMRMDERLNRFAMRQELAAANSPLCEIPHDIIEEIHPSRGERSVATAAVP